MSQNVILSDRPADDQQKVLCFMEAEFISSGYMYNGCIEASAANSERVGMPWENFVSIAGGDSLGVLRDKLVC